MEIEVNDENFDKEVIEKSKQVPVLVDFWAPWCPPCRMLSPILTKIGKNFGDKLIIAKLNVDENPEKSREYGIMGIPSVKLFKNGEIINEFVGAQPENNILRMLERNGVKNE